MNIKKVWCVLVLLAIMQAGPNIQAQNVGFVVAIAPPALPAQQPRMQTPQPTGPPQPRPAFQSSVQPFPVSPVQQFGFGPSPITPFGFGVTPHMVPPIISTSYSPIFGQFQQLTSGSGIAGNGITIIVPNGTMFTSGNIFTNSTVIYQQPSVLGQNHSTGVIKQQAQPTAQPVYTPPAVGTPRNQVLQEFGTPSATVITREGEVLFFTGGVEIIIRDGKVARPD